MAARHEMLRFEANDYYANLNLDPGASLADVRRHFRQLALKWHPDKHPPGHERDRATEIFQLINEAHEVLIDPDKRERYNIVWNRRHQAQSRQRIPDWALSAGGARGSSAEPAQKSSSLIGRGPAEESTGGARGRGASSPGRGAAATSGAAAAGGVRTSSPPHAANLGQRRSAPEFPAPESHDPWYHRHRASAGPAKPSARKPPGGSLRETRRASVMSDLEKERQQREAKFKAHEQESRKREQDEERQRLKEKKFWEDIEWQRRMREENRRSSWEAEEDRPRTMPPPERDPNQKSEWDSFIDTLAQRKLARDKAAKEKEEEEKLAEILKQRRRAAAAAVPAAPAAPGAARGGAAGSTAAPRANTVPAFVTCHDEDEDPYAQPQPRALRRSETAPCPAPKRSDSGAEEVWAAVFSNVGKTTAEVTEVAMGGAALGAAAVANGLSNMWGAFVSPVAWLTRPAVRPEALPAWTHCPRCSGALPQVRGANFCPDCHYILRG